MSLSSPGNLNASPSPTCGICLETVSTSTSSATTLICSHVFHRQCIHQWWMTKSSTVDKTCPICKRVIHPATQVDDSPEVQIIEPMSPARASAVHPAESVAATRSSSPRPRTSDDTPQSSASPTLGPAATRTTTDPTVPEEDVTGSVAAAVDTTTIPEEDVTGSVAAAVDTTATDPTMQLQGQLHSLIDSMMGQQRQMLEMERRRERDWEEDRRRREEDMLQAERRREQERVDDRRRREEDLRDMQVRIQAAIGAFMEPPPGNYTRSSDSSR